MTSPINQTPRRLFALVVLVSAAVLGFEICLMRMLLIASWHHFAFVVISIALLGFGASGTWLTLFQDRLKHRARSVMFVLAIATAVSMPCCSMLASYVPIEARFAPALLWKQAAQWLAYWAILSVPFLAGASVICLALMGAGQRVAGVYAANLFGSAAGSAGATVAMMFVPTEWLAMAAGTVAAIGALVSVESWSPRRAIVVLMCFAVPIAWTLIDTPRVRTDAYKYSAFVQRLAEQGSANRIAMKRGPKSTIEIWRSDTFHSIPFLSGLSVSGKPPSIDHLMIDGHLAGSLLRITTADEATIVDGMLTAAPYEFATSSPRVLLLGETGSANVWLALRRRAAHVDVVQGDDRLTSLHRNLRKDEGIGWFGQLVVTAHSIDPRRFIDTGVKTFDLIQLSSLESMAAGSGGIGGLGQDHLITTQGLAACLRGLKPNGLLTVTRGIQTPPRDNVKLLATLISAMRQCGYSKPDRHVVIVRDFLGVCTIVKQSPWSDDQIDHVRRVCDQHDLAPVWFTGIQPHELNSPHVLPAAPNGVGDWYHLAARQLFDPSASDRFIDDYLYDIRPPTDDRPFFHDFFRFRSMSELQRAYGGLWLTRAELAFLFVIATIVMVTVVGAVLTLLPLARRSRPRGRTAVVVLYFTAIGLAYLMIEMSALSQLTRLIGDPVRAAAVTIAAFLVWSGLGSMTAQRMGSKVIAWAPRLMLCLIVIGAIDVFALMPIAAAIGHASTALRIIIAVLAVAPIAFLMGFPMPAALSQLDRIASPLISWAWASNGFASVLAAPLAVALGMTWGFTPVALVALTLYLFAAMLFTRSN